MTHPASQSFTWAGGCIPQKAAWRSLLFMPADVRRHWPSAVAAAPDAVVIDLEDGVGEARKASARVLAREAAAYLSGNGFDVLVRVNAEPQEMSQDLGAAIGPGIAAVVAPKVSRVEQILALARALDDLEVSQSLPWGSIGLVPLIESAAGLTRIAELAGAHSRVRAIAIGDEDLAAELGIEPDSPTLALARRLLVIAAATAGVQSLGLCGSIANFGDLESLREGAERASRLGLSGSFCIHPRQVPVLQAAFSPSAGQIARAERILAAYAEATRAGRSVASLDGRMVDKPIAVRAARLLSRRAPAQRPGEG